MRYLVNIVGLSLIFLVMLLVVFNQYMASIVVLGSYLFIIFLFSRRWNVFHSGNLLIENSIVSPINGIIKNIRKDVEHFLFGKDLIEIELTVSCLWNTGVYMPVMGEVKERVEKRMANREVLLLLIIKNSDEKIGIQMFKSPWLLSPKLSILPGDRGDPKANLGFVAPWETLLLYLPRNYEILVNKGDRVKVGTILT